MCSLSERAIRPARGTRAVARASFRLVLAVIVVLGFTGCEMAPGPGDGPGQGPGHRAQRLGLPPDQELALGEQAYEQVLHQARRQILPADDPRVQRVRDIARRVVRAAGIRPLQREINLDLAGYRFEWAANVIADRRVNAFCLPGGKIAVYTGILPVAENDDQLATVLSHEIAHALAHHSNERVTREESGGVNVFLDKAFDRRQESEADHIGVFLMTFAGYDPKEAVRFWANMQRSNPGGSGLPEILSDHPSDEERIRNMQNWVPRALAGKRAFDEGHIAPSAR